jgi:hypothetical protein
MYKYIINPKTNRKVHAMGRIGRQIIKQYIQNQRGGDGYKINIIVPFRDQPALHAVAGQDRRKHINAFFNHMLFGNKPRGWTETMSRTRGKKYYTNTATRETRWTPPPREKSFINKVCERFKVTHGFKPVIDITIVEQTTDDQRFNRGALLNVGFLEHNDYNVFIFHDVDLLPNDSMIEHYANVYGSEDVVHLAAGWGRYGANPNYIGGVTLFGRDIFGVINGFPNTYWGWGGEDDELLRRLRTIGYPVDERLQKIRVEDPFIDLEGVATAGEKRALIKSREVLLDNIIKREQAELHESTWVENGIRTDGFYEITEKLRREHRLGNFNSIVVNLNYELIHPEVDEKTIRADLFEGAT